MPPADPDTVVKVPSPPADAVAGKAAAAPASAFDLQTARLRAEQAARAVIPDSLLSLGQRAIGTAAVPDLAALLGLFGTVGLIGGAIFLESSLGAFLNLPSALIVLGGTVAVTMLAFPAADLKAAFRRLPEAMLRRRGDLRLLGLYLVRTAEIVREKGVLALSGVLPQMRTDPALAQAMQLVNDGTPADEVEGLVEGAIASARAERLRTAAVLRRAAEVAPAMGLIGTLVGLVQMLGSLSDPSGIGPAMAVALLTTFYGAVLGTAVLAPLATRMERAAGDLALRQTFYLLAAGCMARRQNPRRLELQIDNLLPEGQRIAYFD